MRLVFFGTPVFAVPVLKALLSGRHEISAVFTRPDRRKGRSGKPSPSPVRAAAESGGVSRILCPEKFSRAALEPLLSNLGADAGIVAAFGLIFRPWIFRLFRHGLINVHPSLLPRHRGPAPVQGAILAGDRETGVSIMRLDEGMDTGDVLLAESCPLRPDETAGELEERLSLMAPPLLLRALDGIEAGTERAVPQDGSKATGTRMLAKEDGAIDWNLGAAAIHRLVMAANPWPGAITSFRGEDLHVWRSAAIEGPGGPPGALFFPSRDRLAARAGSGALEILEVQRPGKRRLSAADFRNGSRIAPGETLK